MTTTARIRLRASHNEESQTIAVFDVPDGSSPDEILEQWLQNQPQSDLEPAESYFCRIDFHPAALTQRTVYAVITLGVAQDQESLSIDQADQFLEWLHRADACCPCPPWVESFDNVEPTDQP